MKQLLIACVFSIVLSSNDNKRIQTQKRALNNKINRSNEAAEFVSLTPEDNLNVLYISYAAPQLSSFRDRISHFIARNLFLSTTEWAEANLALVMFNCPVFWALFLGLVKLNSVCVWIECNLDWLPIEYKHNAARTWCNVNSGELHC